MLRSHWWATSFSDPYKQYGLARYFQESGQYDVDPLPVEILIQYGFWFQKHMVPHIDEMYVKTKECKEEQFVLILTDNRVIQNRVAVMAPGLHYYTYRPTDYDHLPAELVSYSSEHRTFDRFADKSVIFIGRGQSAF